jgi:cysteine desulfurase/selenocysteine lyase
MTAVPPDWSRVRADFPLLRRRAASGATLVYLDNAATAQKPQSVIDALVRYYTEGNANVHRGLHELAEDATLRFEQARRTVADFVRAPCPEGVIWTRGTTEAINLVAHSWARPCLRPGDAILVTQLEHHSNLVPWQMLARERNLVLRVVPIDGNGEVDREAFRTGLRDGRVRLAAFPHVSNALGTVNPVAELVAEARAAGAVTMVDGAQAVPHLPVDVTALGADFYAFSGHKACGPTGIGALIVRRERLEEMEPFLGGGEMIHRVYPTHATWGEPPLKFEAGTPHIEGAIGLGVALDYLTTLGMDPVHARITALTDLCVARLREIPGLRLVGTPRERGGAVSFLLEGLHPHDVAQIADQEGVALRAGHLCCQPLMDALGVTALTRASFSFYNEEGEVDRLVHALGTARRILGHG